MKQFPRLLAAFERLDQEQRAAVLEDRNCSVIAGPGSGKTSVMSVKGARLLTDPGQRVLAVTFSKAGARELIDRTKTLVPELRDIHDRFRGGTFHSLAMKQTGIRAAQIVAEGDRLRAIAHAQKLVGDDRSLEEASQAIENAKSGARAATEEDRALADAYQARLAALKLVDFQDTLLRAVEGMRAGTIRPIGATHLLGDEWQDSDSLQLAWAQCHADAGTIITSVGDDDQSIYAFRGAQGYAGMRSFAEANRSAHVVLGTNYRCRSEVLASATQVIRCNAERIEKHLVAHRGTGGEALAACLKGDRSEAAWIVASIREQPGGTTAVLARRNRDLILIETELRRREIPYRLSKRTSLFDFPEGTLVDAVSALLAGRAGGDHLARVYNHLHIAASDVAALKRLGDSMVQSKPLAAAALVSDQAASERLADLLARLPKWRQLMEDNVHNLCVAGILEWVAGASPSADKRGLGVVTRILGALEGPLESRLDVFRRPQPTPETGDEGVVDLMTLHAAKGLEWDCVYLASCNEGVVPDPETPVSEERRLFYVGLTRARDRLCVTAQGNRPVSPFVHEAGLLVTYHD